MYTKKKKVLEIFVSSPDKEIGPYQTFFEGDSSNWIPHIRSCWKEQSRKDETLQKTNNIEKRIKKVISCPTFHLNSVINLHSSEKISRKLFKIKTKHLS